MICPNKEIEVVRPEQISPRVAKKYEPKTRAVGGEPLSVVSACDRTTKKASGI